MTRVRCRGLDFAYNGTRVLDGVAVTVEAGEWVAIVGPNGAGKTTLLRAIAGVIEAGGEIDIDGRSLPMLSRRDRAAAVALVPQAPVIPDGMTVFDYVLLGRTPYISYWGWESETDLARVDEVLDRLDLAAFATRPLTSLSGGERQRAILGRALAQDASVLLLDEPTTALDLGHQQQVLELVDELRTEKGIAVLSPLHDLTLAAQYADRVAVMDGGRVVTVGKPHEVITDELVQRRYGASVEILRTAAGEVVVAPRRPRPEGDA